MEIIVKDKKEVGILADTPADITEVLNKLSQEASKSVNAYIKNSENVNAITEQILSILSKEEEIVNMEHDELMKLLTISTNLQTKPLEQFTKLFVQMNQFQDKLNINKELDQLRELKENFNIAKEEAEQVKPAAEDTEVLDGDYEETEEYLLIKNLIKE